jgi:hypothetical protein
LIVEAAKRLKWLAFKHCFLVVVFSLQGCWDFQHTIKDIGIFKQQKIKEVEILIKCDVWFVCSKFRSTCVLQISTFVLQISTSLRGKNKQTMFDFCASNPCAHCM